MPTEFETLAKEIEMQNQNGERRNPMLEHRAHLEKGIWREAIETTYAGATEAGMTANECIYAAVVAGALSLVKSRAVELEGFSHRELARLSWEQMRFAIPALRNGRDYETRKQLTIAFVTRSLTRIAFEYWRSRAVVTATWT
jgi:hypothetical protein